MKRKPCLHDGIVTIDLGKNRLVEIPHSGSEAWIHKKDSADQQALEMQPSPSPSNKECNVHLHVNCACAFGMHV